MSNNEIKNVENKSSKRYRVWKFYSYLYPCLKFVHITYKEALAISWVLFLSVFIMGGDSLRFEHLKEIMPYILIASMAGGALITLAVYPNKLILDNPSDCEQEVDKHVS